MAHHVVNGGANGFRKPVIVKRGRDRLLLVDHVTMADVVNLVGGHAGADVRADHVKDLGGQAPGLTHAGNVRWGLQAHGIRVSRREGVRRAPAEMLGSAGDFRNKIPRWRPFQAQFARSG